MTLQLRWVGGSDEELDRVAETRMQCYAHSAGDLDRYRTGIRGDPRAKPGGFLLAEQDGRAVGTSTIMPLNLWIRSASVPCQGVAYVGTVKTHRRGSGGEGIATRLMHETLRVAREQGSVVSALMPFRASFYEHFGYGLVERRCDWTVPLPVLPAGGFEGVRFFEPADLQELHACRQRMAEKGQCDIERSLEMWSWMLHRADDGFFVVDRPKADGGVRGWAYLRHSHENAKDLLKVVDLGYDDVPCLLRLLHFLASLRDQYLSAVLLLSGEFPLNLLLRETQVPHRPVNHATAECRNYTRLQLRILDLRRLIEPMRLSPRYKGKVSVVVHETGEGPAREARVEPLRLDLADGRVSVINGAGAGDADFECRDTTWASVVCGDLRATTAMALGVAQGTAAGAAVLDAFADGPAPFCGEYF